MDAVCNACKPAGQQIDQMAVGSVDPLADHGIEGRTERQRQLLAEAEPGEAEADDHVHRPGVNAPVHVGDAHRVLRPLHVEQQGACTVGVPLVRDGLARAHQTSLFHQLEIGFVQVFPVIEKHQVEAALQCRQDLGRGAVEERDPVAEAGHLNDCPCAFDERPADLDGGDPPPPIQAHPQA